MPFKEIAKSIAQTYSHFSYIVLSIAFFIIFFVIISVIDNVSFLTFIFSSDFIPLQEKMLFILTIFTSFLTKHTFATFVLTLFLLMLMSINVTLFIYYIQREKIKKRVSGTNIIGMVIGFIGIGCSACGSIFLTSIIGLSASTAVLAFLPFHGKELIYIGILILIISTAYLAYSIQKPAICKVKIQEK